MHNGERNERSVTYLGTNMASKFEKFSIYIYFFTFVLIYKLRHTCKKTKTGLKIMQYENRFSFTTVVSSNPSRNQVEISPLA